MKTFLICSYTLAAILLIAGAFYFIKLVDTAPDSGERINGQYNEIARAAHKIMFCQKGLLPRDIERAIYKTKKDDWPMIVKKFEGQLTNFSDQPINITVSPALLLVLTSASAGGEQLVAEYDLTKRTVGDKDESQLTQQEVAYYEDRICS